MIGTARQKGQLALYTFSLVVATLGIIARLWARRITQTRWQANDYLMLAAYSNVVGLVIAAIIAVVKGELGAHQKDIPLERQLELMPLNMKIVVAIPPLLISSSIFVKMSITHFYIALFPHTALSRLCKIQLIALVISWFALVLPCFFVCVPLAKMWDPTIKGKCFDVKKFWLGSSIIALFFDLSCVVLPIPTFWRLQTTTMKKVKLTFIFGLGFFICIISICRTIYDEFLSFDDLTWTASPIILFTVPEPSLGIVAGCVPITLPLFKYFRSSFHNSKLGTFYTRTTSRTLTANTSSTSRRASKPTSSKPLPALPSFRTQFSSTNTTTTATTISSARSARTNPTLSPCHGKFTKLPDSPPSPPDLAPLTSVYTVNTSIASPLTPSRSPIERGIDRVREAMWNRDLLRPPLPTNTAGMTETLQPPQPRFNEVRRGSVEKSTVHAGEVAERGVMGITVRREIVVRVHGEGDEEGRRSRNGEREKDDWDERTLS